MFKAVKNLQEQKGFTLIELLIVVAIIGILAAVGIPGYIGMQERGRKGAVTRTCESNVSELQGFIISARKANTANLNSLVEVDTDGDGVVDPALDSNNFDLGSTNFPVATFIGRHALGAGMPINSPWDSTLALFVDGGVVADLAACETAAIAVPSQVSICYSPSDDAAIRRVFVVAVDIDSNIVFSKTITAD